jgi:hypothetical protein
LLYEECLSVGTPAARSSREHARLFPA